MTKRFLTPSNQGKTLTLSTIGELPELPRVLKKREAAITPLVNAWMHENMRESCAWEIKQTTGKRVARSAVLPHQLAALRDVASPRGIVHKISDESRRRQPFDAFCLVNARAYVICCFLHSGVRIAIGIDAHEWQGATRETEGAFSFRF